MNRSTEESSSVIEYSSKFFNKITFEKIVNNSSANNKENHFLNNNSKIIVKKVKDFGMFGVMNSSNVTKTLLDSDDTNDSKDGYKLNRLMTGKSASTTESENDSPGNNEKSKNKNKLKGTNKTVSMKVQGTPGRKGLPLSQAVARRNARERNRVKQVNNGFAALRQCIPDIIAESFESSSNSGNTSRGCAKKLSKVETLRMAVEYIRSLEGLLKQDNINKPDLNKTFESNLSEMNFFVHDDSGCEFKQEIDFDDDEDFLSGTENNEIFEGANSFDPVGDYIAEKETLNESSCIQPSFAFVLKDSKLNNNNNKNANKMHNVLSETMPSNKVKKESTSAVVDEKENENILTSNKNKMPLKDSFLSPMKSNILQTSSPSSSLSSFKKTSKQENMPAINADETKYQVFIDHLTTTNSLAAMNKDPSKPALFQTGDFTIKDMLDNELSFGDSVTPKTIRTLFDPDRNLSFYEGMIYFEKESDDFPLKATTNSKTASLSEESMMESIDWWESYNCGAIIPDEAPKN